MIVHTMGTDSTKISVSKRTREVAGAALGWGRLKRHNEIQCVNFGYWMKNKHLLKDILGITGET